MEKGVDDGVVSLGFVLATRQKALVVWLLRNFWKELIYEYRLVSLVFCSFIMMYFYFILLYFGLQMIFFVLEGIVDFWNLLFWRIIKDYNLFLVNLI